MAQLFNRGTMWAEHCRSYQATIAIGVFGDEVTVNERSSSLLFFLRNDPDASKRISVSYGRTKTDSESLEPPTNEMRREHPHEKCRT